MDRAHIQPQTFSDQQTCEINYLVYSPLSIQRVTVFRIAPFKILKLVAGKVYKRYQMFCRLWAVDILAIQAILWPIAVFKDSVIKLLQCALKRGCQSRKSLTESTLMWAFIMQQEYNCRIWYGAGLQEFKSAWHKMVEKSIRTANSEPLEVEH